MAQPHLTDNVRPEAASAMMAVLNGAWAARLVHAAAELGLADYLVDGARDVAFLADSTKSHAPSLACYVYATGQTIAAAKRLPPTLAPTQPLPIARLMRCSQSGTGSVS